MKFKLLTSSTNQVDSSTRHVYFECNSPRDHRPHFKNVYPLNPDVWALTNLHVRFFMVPPDDQAAFYTFSSIMIPLSTLHLLVFHLKGFHLKCDADFVQTWKLSFSSTQVVSALICPSFLQLLKTTRLLKALRPLPVQLQLIPLQTFWYSM